MKIKTAIITIFSVILLPITWVVAQSPGEEIDVVTVTGQVTVDIYSTLTLNPITVEIYEPSTVTVTTLTPSGEGVPGREIEIYCSDPDLIITQPSNPTNSNGITTGSVYSAQPGTYLVCAKDVTLGYDIEIQNCMTLYVVPVPVPTFLEEPYYTKGTTNTVLWNDLGPDYEYYVEVSEDPDFETVLGGSGWSDKTSHQFTDLENEKMYFYRVKARNPYGGQSDWSSSVFSVQDSEPPEIEVVSIGDVGDNTTTEWDPNYTVEMMFKVTDNLELDDVTFFCVDSEGNRYSCIDSYQMEGDNLVVTVELRDLERVSGAYLRESYGFCVEAVDSAGNVTRNCNILLTIPPGEVEEPTQPPIIDIIEKTLDDINQTLDNTIGQLDPDSLERVTTATSFITVSTALLITIGALINLPYFLIQFVLNFLSWLGLRGGTKPIGYVYNSLTKDPISQAVVRVYDEEGKMVWSDVTDGKGYFSARIESGKYKIIVRAANYTFPSTIVFGKEDYPLTNIYHGEEFIINGNETPDYAIPLDPIEASKLRVWREILWGRFKSLFNVINILLFVIGLVLAIYLYSKKPYWLTRLVLFLYIPSFLLMVGNIFKKRERYGTVKDLEGNLVQGVSVALREAEFDKVVIKRVTDENGRYRILANKGRYYLEVLEASYKVESIEGDSEILLEKDDKWIVNDIIVSKIEKE